MKLHKSIYLFALIFIAVLAACSTKKDRFINRQFQAMNTKYNVMYNGNMALDKGVEDLKLKYKDDYWDILPIERMQVTEEDILPGETRNANFDRAEEKAVKAIQKRSMNIDGVEKNPQIDEAHMLLGKARYYDQRYVPALEAFNYILYKYPKSDKIYEARIWRERTNMRMENDALAIKNLRALLSEIKFKNQVFADANATLAQAFLNIGEKDSAIARLNKAIEFTKQDEEKARYRFILGQLYEQDGDREKAAASFTEVIEMNRKSPRRYVLQAQNKLAQQFDYEKGDTVAFLENYQKLLKDRENRPYLDILNHQMALFYGNRKKYPEAISYYNKSLKSNSQDMYLIASNYRNLADIYFDRAKYQDAGLYYDSTLVQLNPRTREYKLIRKKRENLADVIKFEAIAQRNDSILNVVSLSEADRRSFYEDYIVKLKKTEAEQAKLAKEKQERADREARNTGSADDVADSGRSAGMKTSPTSPGQNTKAGNPADKGVFYFYNPTAAAFGKVDFKKKWGGRRLTDNWRLSSAAEKNMAAETEQEKQDEVAAATEAEPKYTADFYLAQLPKDRKVLDSLAKERNFAYFQLGVIYKEKFKEYKLAASKLEQLLNNKPEERLVLPTMYNLLKIYEITDKDKALAMKKAIIDQFPDSRYAQIISSGTATADQLSMTPDAAYQRLFQKFEEGDLRTLLPEIEAAIDQYTAEEIAPKMELLRARTIGKLQGIAEYKKAVNYVALNYPNSEEGKESELLLSYDILKLERLQFNETEPSGWKIIYKAGADHTPQTKKLIATIDRFTKERTSQRLTMSVDLYTMTEDFVVIHGMATEDNARGIVSILKDYKEYAVEGDAIVISTDNYKVVQVKKNLEEYLLDPKKPAVKLADLPPPPSPKPVVPQQPAKGKESRTVPKANVPEMMTDDPAPTKGQPKKGGTNPEKSSTTLPSTRPPGPPKRP